jgi:tryptophan synthase alpha chain
MTGAIAETFRKLRDRGEKAFIPFVTAGDPDLGTTISLVPELARAGCDIVELGVPFSDPVADGPTIQRSSERALRHGCRLADILQAVREIRKCTAVPIVLFSYYNPLYQYGVENLARDAAAAGVDGVLATDLTPEESGAYRELLGAAELDTIFLAAPTSTEERLARIAASTRGFVYLVSRTGVTGARERLSDTVAPTLGLLRRHTSLPVAVGFGISRPEHVKAVWEIADGAVVGSAIVGMMENCGGREAVLARVSEFCAWLTGRPLANR